MTKTATLIVLNLFPKDVLNPRIRTTLLIGTSEYNPWHKLNFKTLKRNLQGPAIDAADGKTATWADIRHASDEILAPYNLKTYDIRKTATIDGVVVINLDENEIIKAT